MHSGQKNKEVSMKRLAWIGGMCLLVIGFLSSCAKPPEQKVVKATAQPYHVGDYELILDPVAGTSELRPVATSRDVSPTTGGGGFTIGVRGWGGTFAGGQFRQNWCVYNNNSGADIYGVAMIAKSYSGTAPSYINGDNPNANCYADSCGACGSHNGPYHFAFFTSSTAWQKGYITQAANDNCNTGTNHSAGKSITVTVGGATSITLALMIYLPSGEVVDSDADRGIGTAPAAVNDVFAMLGKQSPDPALPALLCGGNYIPSTGASSNYFVFPVATTSYAMPAHAVTVGKAGYANLTVYNTNLGYTIMPIKSKTVPPHYAVGNYNGTLNQAWNASPVATTSFVDTAQCNQVLGIGIAAPDISYPDVYNLSLDILLGQSVTKHMVAGTSCGGNTTNQYQSLPANLLAIGQTEFLRGIRTPAVTNAYGILNANEYWIPGTGGVANTFVGIAGNVDSRTLVSIVNATWQDAPISFSAVLTSLNIVSYGYRKGVTVSGNKDGEVLNLNIPTTGRLTYTMSGLDTVGLLRNIMLIGLNAVDFTDNDQPVRLGALSLAATAAASIASYPVSVPYTNIGALGQPLARPVMAAFAADLEGFTTNEGTIAVLYRQNLSGNFAARTFSKWLKLTSMDWTGIQAGAGTNKWVGFSDPDNAVTSNFGLMQVQASTRQTITVDFSFTFPFNVGVWQLMSNPSSTSGFVFPDLPASSPGVLPNVSTQSIDVGTSAAVIPSGNPYYSGWDSNANLYNVLNRGMIGYGTDDTLAADSLSMNKFSVGGVKAICPRPSTYLAAGPVKISGYIAAYQWDNVSVSSGTVVKIRISYKDEIGGGSCASGFAGATGDSCDTYFYAPVSGGTWVQASVPLATNQYNKVNISPCGAGSTPVLSQTTTDWTCTSTGGGGDSMLFCTGAPSGSSAAGAATICTNSGGPLCPP